MIYRQHNEEWLFITQPAHAWMTGKLAAAWGNPQFAAPSPREAVILATRLHDIGWLTWDTKPRLGDDGRPINFLNTTMEETIPIWRQAVEWVRIMNPYAALLVSIHASTIYGRRPERSADPTHEQALLDDLMQEQQQFQASLKSELAAHPLYGDAIEEAPLAAAYRWLRVCDLLSLIVLSGIFPPEGQIDEVPAGNPQQLTTLNYRLSSPFLLELSPWPFSRPDFQIQIDGRYLKPQRFNDQPAYHAALENAPWQPITVTLREIGDL